ALRASSPRGATTGPRMTTDTDAKLIEAGRKLFARDWQFIWAAPSIETLPPMAALEIAFAGRSNVGKSSLINALTGRNKLARPRLCADRRAARPERCRPGRAQDPRQSRGQLPDRAHQDRPGEGRRPC